MDGRTVYDKGMYKTAFELAEQEGINIQVKKAIAGGNDAGAISVSGDGCETAVISVPCRYIHSPASVICKDDFTSTKKLVKCILDNINIYKPTTKEVLK